MDITPEEEEEEVNPLVVTFEKLNTQLEKLAERDRRAEERERNALEREQALIERQSKLNQAMNNIAIKSGNFQSSVIDTETRLKTFLLDYIKDFPNSTGIIEAIAKETKSLEGTVNRIPKSIAVKGDFHGFTSRKPFLAYWGLMFFTVFLSAYFYFRSSDNEQIKEYKRLVEDFRRKNPKLADKYFGNWYQRNIESPVKELFQK